MASVQVLGTVELLEAILLQLPIKDLLLAQLISKHIENTIDGSDSIQKALFFKPADPALVDHNGVPIKPTANPFIFSTKLLENALGASTTSDKHSTPPCNLLLWSDTDPAPCDAAPIPVLEFTLRVPRPDAGRAGSWRRMQLTSPPTRLALYFVRRGERATTKRVEFRGTLGELVDRAFEVGRSMCEGPRSRGSRR